MFKKFQFLQFCSQMYHSATFQEEKERILYALASMKDEALLGQLLKFALSVSLC